MYGKLFAQMYDGTLAGNWKALVTFQQMIVLCDSAGVIDMTPEALARRTGIPLDVIQEGIAALEAPDPSSRTPDNDGRRIERLDAHRTWGWMLVNHRKYQQMVSHEEKREADRQRIAAKRASQQMSQDVATCRGVSQPVADVAYTDTDTDTDTKEKNIFVVADGSAIDMRHGLAEKSVSRPPPCPHTDLVDIYHQTLPTLPRVVVLTNQRKEHLQARWRQVWEDERFDTNRGLELFRGFFLRVAQSKFLTGRVSTPDRKPFRADLAWLVKPENFAKVLEGKYE